MSLRSWRLMFSWVCSWARGPAFSQIEGGACEIPTSYKCSRARQDAELQGGTKQRPSWVTRDKLIKRWLAIETSIWSVVWCVCVKFCSGPLMLGTWNHQCVWRCVCVQEDADDTQHLKHWKENMNETKLWSLSPHSSIPRFPTLSVHMLSKLHLFMFYPRSRWLLSSKI